MDKVIAIGLLLFLMFGLLMAADAVVNSAGDQLARLEAERTERAYANAQATAHQQEGKTERLQSFLAYLAASQVIGQSSGGISVFGLLRNLFAVFGVVAAGYICWLWFEERQP